MMTPLDEQDDRTIFSIRIKVKDDPVDIAALLGNALHLGPLIPAKAGIQRAGVKQSLGPPAFATTSGSKRCMQTKTPGGFPPGAVIPQATIMSGIEVAMDAEAELPVVHVGGSRRGAADHQLSARWHREARQPGVHDVDAQVEIFGDVPLCSRT
jgi:hypothetical protein